MRRPGACRAPPPRSGRAVAASKCVRRHVHAFAAAGDLAGRVAGLQLERDARRAGGHRQRSRRPRVTAGRDVEAIDAQREQAPQRLGDAAVRRPTPCARSASARRRCRARPRRPSSGQAIDVTAVGVQREKPAVAERLAGPRSASSSKRRLDRREWDPARRRARRRPAPLASDASSCARARRPAPRCRPGPTAGCSPAASARQVGHPVRSPQVRPPPAAPRSPRRRRAACSAVRSASRARARARSAMERAAARTAAPRRRIVMRWTVLRSNGGSRRARAPARSPPPERPRRASISRTRASAAATTASAISPRVFIAGAAPHVTAPAMSGQQRQREHEQPERPAHLADGQAGRGAADRLGRRRRRALRDRTATRSRSATKSAS